MGRATLLRFCERSIALVVAAVALAEAPAILSTPAVAAPFALLREQIVSDPSGGAIEAHSIAPSDDQSIVVAGRIPSTQQAWAIKLDARGKVIWRHVVDLKSHLPIGYGASYNGAARMPDGSTFLCGEMPAEPSSFAKGLITHLDPTGRVLTEELVTPPNPSQTGIARLLDCRVDRGGVVFLGTIWRPGSLKFGSVGRSSGSTESYWVIATDAAGNKQWEGSFPSKILPAIQISTILTDDSGSMLFSATGNDGRTELLRISWPDGAAESVTIAGFYKFAHGVGPGGIQELFGRDSAGKLNAISVDDQLRVSSEITLGSMSQFVPYEAYALGDGSIVGFGSAVSSASRYSSAVALFDSARGAPDVLSLRSSRYPDGGHSNAAAQLGSGEDFVVARCVIGHTPDRRGLALDFVAPN